VALCLSPFTVYAQIVSVPPFLFLRSYSYFTSSADLVFGTEIQRLYLLFQCDRPFPPNFEEPMLVISPWYHFINTADEMVSQMEKIIHITGDLSLIS
jgi:hypothetical protein